MNLKVGRIAKISEFRSVTQLQIYIKIIEHPPRSLILELILDKPQWWLNINEKAVIDRCRALIHFCIKIKLGYFCVRCINNFLLILIAIWNFHSYVSQSRNISLPSINMFCCDISFGRTIFSVVTWYCKMSPFLIILSYL